MKLFVARRAGPVCGYFGIHRIAAAVGLGYRNLSCCKQRRAEPWWSHPASAKILVLEYFKYIVATARIGLDAPPGATTVAASRGRAKI